MHSYGMPMPAREKRVGDLKIYVPPTLEETLQQLADKEKRSVSSYCYRVLEEHVALKTFQQQIRGAGQAT